jgi:hypothetical protein
MAGLDRGSTVAVKMGALAWALGWQGSRPRAAAARAPASSQRQTQQYHSKTNPKAPSSLLGCKQHFSTRDRAHDCLFSFW